MMTTTHDQDAQGIAAEALVTPGTMLAWGSNRAGQLGDGTTTNRTAPASVPGVAGITAMAAGNGHVLALLSNGTVRAWAITATASSATVRQMTEVPQRRSRD